ncbi:MAG: hypothetical protein IKJ41_04945 [Clostridia bacterium]|nr:hypothetical protein [Clostridia bacterium]
MASNNERKLIRLLRNIDDDIGFITGVCLGAREKQKVDELVSLLEDEADINEDDIINFLLDDDSFEDAD